MKTVEKIRLSVIAFIVSIIAIHPAIPHDHHFSDSIEIHSEACQHPHQAETNIHCILLNEVVYQKNTIAVCSPLISTHRSPFINIAKNIIREILPDNTKFSEKQLLFSATVSPTRGSPPIISIIIR